MRLRSFALVAASVALLAPQPAAASENARYGVRDDARLAFGPGTLERRLDILEMLGVRIVRYTLRWDQIAAERPQDARSGDDPAYAWGVADEVLEGLRERGHPRHGLDLGTPEWANRGQGPNWAPVSGSTIANFVRAALGATRG